MKSKKRNYYSKDNNLSISGAGKYLLRWYCDTDCTIYHKGPYHNKDKAKEELTALLLTGVCSWLVSYNE